MKRGRPRQHKRRLKSGRRITINRGLKRKRRKNYSFVVTKKGIKPSEQVEEVLFDFSRRVLRGEELKRRPILSPEEAAARNRASMRESRRRRAPVILKQNRQWYKDNITRERARQAFRDDLVKPEFKPGLKKAWVDLGIKPFVLRDTK